MIKIPQPPIENLIELFIDKIITEKNLSDATVSAYNVDLKGFSIFFGITDITDLLVFLNIL